MQPFDEVGDRVFRRRYEYLDSNIGVVIGDDEVLVVDSRATHRQADELIAELAVLTTLPVRYLVNTHWHWDHVWGNARFPNVEIWGHTRTRLEIIERGEEARADVLGWIEEEHRRATQEVELVAPEHTFTALADLVVGGRLVQLRYHGRAHTDADVVIHVPDAGVTFLGDLVEEGSPPSFGDSYPLDWPVTLEVVEQTLHPVVVPGHGDVVGRVFVATQRAELAEIARLVEEASAGADREATLRAMPYPEEYSAEALERGLAQLAGRVR